MTKITLVFFVISSIVIGSVFAQSQDNSQPHSDDHEREHAQEEAEDDNERAGAAARAVASAGAAGNVRPPPGPYPGPPRPNPRPTPYPPPVTCHSCIDCQNVNEQTPSKVCTPSSDPSKNGVCTVYAEKYKHMERPLYIRGCASERGSCNEIQKAHEHNDVVQLKFCKECRGNKCNTSNGVSRSLPDISMGFFVLVITPLLAKLTLT